MAPTNELHGTVALVTGASSGIGEATTRSLAARGAKVAIAARRRDRLDALADQLQSEGAEVEVIEADVSQQAQADNAVGQAVGRFGRLDVLVNNAGTMLLGPIEGAPLHEWNTMLEANVNGLIYSTHAALPHLLRAAEDQSSRGVADIVMVSSVSGRVAQSGSGVYNLTKFGVGGFSESLRQEVTARHVRVCVVEPGATSTELASRNRPEVQDAIARTFAGVEMLDAGDVAESIAFAVTRDRRASINEILIRPTEQVQ